MNSKILKARKRKKRRERRVRRLTEALSSALSHANGPVFELRAGVLHAIDQIGVTVILPPGVAGETLYLMNRGSTDVKVSAPKQSLKLHAKETAAFMHDGDYWRVASISSGNSP